MNIGCLPVALFCNNFQIFPFLNNFFYIIPFKVAKMHSLADNGIIRFFETALHVACNSFGKTRVRNRGDLKVILINYA